MIFNSLVSHVNLTYNTYIVSNGGGGGQVYNKYDRSKVLFPISRNQSEYLREYAPSFPGLSLWSGNILTIKIYLSAPLSFAACYEFYLT